MTLQSATRYQRLWGRPTLAAARAGHRAVTARIGEVPAFLAGHADQLPAPDPALPGGDDDDDD